MTGKVTEEKLQCSCCRSYFPATKKSKMSTTLCEDCARIKRLERRTKFKAKNKRKALIEEHGDECWDWAGTSYGIYF